ncbi:hypothetical protein M427DRAFT_150299 [Gonapodya prolifera JEL478]|uniref:VWFA domain-containing protein n=1 Tax=Gonapodya prolifera (strain JEL478) TaxID=1344416 RepID=A0A138ZX02_GONPJ|nr:hypothetical protein M427DRAFT_150299 [Gonapodya prolifera JEL478]|eukprot:KXS08981.1 hypothetical protein M427DRAFT_150299 [Gonapodya prolifera JEL478]
MSSVPKYIKVNGVLQLNPAFQAASGAAPQTSSLLPGALVPVTSLEDVAQQVKECDPSTKILLSESTNVSVDIVQEALSGGYRPHSTDSIQIVDGLSKIFSTYEVPIGMLNKLLELNECHLSFLLDDSGSMGTKDSVLQNGQSCTRWEEMLDRLKALVDIIAYIPTLSNTFRFLNRADVIRISHKQHTPMSFASTLKSQLETIFRRGPSGSTPMRAKIGQIFSEAEREMQRTVVYIFCDGMPDEGSDAISEVFRRRNANKIPLQFMSCTGNDADVEWAKELESIIPMLGEMDDFVAEREEVLHDQGSSMPYTYGFYLVCALVGPLNPDDLDALDESVPLTKYTLTNLLGRILSDQEYQRYWHNFLNNPRQKPDEQAKTRQWWQNAYSQFANAQGPARQIPLVAKFQHAADSPPVYATYA